MKVADARHAKRERIRSGLELVRSRALDAKAPATREDLAAFFQQDPHRLCRLLAVRYADSVLRVIEDFPEGDAPADVIESHVDVLCSHDEEYARRLFPTDDLVVRVVRGTCTVTRRFYRWLDAGDSFSLCGRSFRVRDVRHETVGSVTEDEARREGVDSLDDWRRQWAERLPRAAGTAEVREDQACVRHELAAAD